MNVGDCRPAVVVDAGVLSGYWRSVTVAVIDRDVVLPHLQQVKTLDRE